MKRTLVEIENLSLSYPKTGKKLPWLFTNQSKHDSLLALNNVSLHLNEGECLGIIGVNGSGKSSLLKVIAGILHAQSGISETHGSIFPLIQANSICQPLLTGRENIRYLAAWADFLPDDWSAFENEIIAFSELNESIDNIWAHYSSGMRARLIFAFALCIKPDILLLDEVLAVGDAGFRAKCYNALAKQKENAGIILVSHDIAQVAYICDRIIWLENGKIRMQGTPQAILNAYLSNAFFGQADTETLHRISPPVTNAQLHIDSSDLNFTDTLRLQFSLQLDQPLQNTWLRILIYHGAGGIIAEADLKQSTGLLNWSKGANTREINIPSLSLQPGLYRLGLQLTHANGLEHYVWLLGLPLTINGDHKGHGHWQLSAEISDQIATSPLT